MRFTLAAVAFIPIVLGVACGGDDLDDNVYVCVAEELAACVPTYEPTFVNIYERTIEDTCSPSGGVCHQTDSASSGLILDEIDTAYAYLTREERSLIEPGAPSCSVLYRRVSSEDQNFRMPLSRDEPGLSEGEICAIQMWIEAGGER